MDRAHINDKFSPKVKMRSKKSTQDAKSQQFPMVFIDRDADFASIKFAAGIEAKVI